MMTEEEYRDYRAEINSSLKSSLFAVQSMFCDAACASFNVHITKKDVNGKPASMNINDVDFLLRRFDEHELDTRMTQFHNYNSLPNSLVSFNIRAT